MRFFERIRTEASRFADGVHHLPAGVSPVELEALCAQHGRRIPEIWAEFLQSHNGMQLFFDSYVLWPIDQQIAQWTENATLQPIGEANGHRLLVHCDDRILEENDDGDRLVVGSNIEDWLLAILGRDALLVDRDGEFLPVFDHDQPRFEVRKKRAAVGRKRDPQSAAWLFEQAELALEKGDEQSAVSLAEAALQIDTEAAAVWQFVGQLKHHSGDLAGAEVAFAHAARSTLHAKQRARRFALAARAARKAGQPNEEHRRSALAADSALAAELCAEAESALAQADLESAQELSSLADAIDPAAAQAVCKKLRLRRLLQPLQ